MISGWCEGFGRCIGWRGGQLTETAAKRVRSIVVKCIVMFLWSLPEDMENTWDA